MKIRWIGHASFQIETGDGLRIRTDPYDSSIGLPVSKLAADAVTISHEHFDHNAVKSVPGSPTILRGESAETIKGVTFKGIPTFHDEQKGAQRGRNTIFLITADGITLAHLGDLGHVLSVEQIKALGPVDVLCVPVGGIYTLDAAHATQVADSVKAPVTIPMHYQIKGLTVGVGPVDRFLAGKTNVRHADEVIVTRKTLPAKPEILVLNPRP